jgi:hypothetical protein
MTKRKRPVLNKKIETKDFSPSGWAGDIVLVSITNYNPPEPVNTVWRVVYPKRDAGSQCTARGANHGLLVGIDGYTNG